MSGGNHLFQPLHEGPLDIIGDIHGEIGALQDLLGVLGYRCHSRPTAPSAATSTIGRESR